MTLIKCLDKGFVRLIDYMASDSAIVQKARVSYGAGTKSVSDDTGLIRYLVRNKHTSPLEGCVFKFHVKAPLFVIRQWQRHRMWSYNELSGRYSEMKDEYYVPLESNVTFQNPDNKQGGTDNQVKITNCKNPEDFIDGGFVGEAEDWFTFSQQFKNEQDILTGNYNNYLKTGMRKELARINLPLSLYTEMYATVDLHNLFHFLKLRKDSHAQLEIREYASGLLELIRPIVPIACKAFEDYIMTSMTFSALELKCLQQILNGYDRGLCSEVIKNKRELAEFEQKLEAIFNK